MISAPCLVIYRISSSFRLPYPSKHFNSSRLFKRFLNMEIFSEFLTSSGIPFQSVISLFEKKYFRTSVLKILVVRLISELVFLLTLCSLSNQIHRTYFTKYEIEDVKSRLHGESDVDRWDNLRYGKNRLARYREHKQSIISK